MTKQKLWPRLLRLLKPYGVLILLSLLLSAAYVTFNLYVPILIGEAVDGIVGPGRVDFALLGELSLRIALCVLAAALTQWLVSLLNNRITYSIVRDVRVRAFSHIQTLPLSTLDGQSSGELMSRLITDVDQFSNGLLMGFSQLFTGVLTILGTLMFMLKGSPLIALCVVVLTPLSLFAAGFITKHSYRYFREQAAVRGRLTALSEELISGGRVLRAYCGEEAAEARFGVLNRELEESGRRAVFFSSLTNPCTRFVNNIVYAAVGTLGALFCIRGSLTVGSLSCFLTYANRYTKPFNEISGVLTELSNALSCISRVYELMEAPSESPDPETPAEIGTPEGAVELRDLAFSYTKEQPLLHGLSVKVRPGQHIAIVGPTGCGKTTLINLLMRFYDADEGQILVDGIPIETLRRKELRACYGMVLQDTWLKAGTVAENIAYGRPEASREEIVRAPKAAHVHSFIRRLPDGYDTVLGEDGGELSQGQRQLLCIARVMLADPPMLILDEATSSIDTLTELRVQRAFEEMMQGRTTFIVAHRLSTVLSADRILVMRDGQVIEQGTHKELMAQQGFYSELVKSQLDNQ